MTKECPFDQMFPVGSVGRGAIEYANKQSEIDAYEARVQEQLAYGISRGDAQGIVDAQDMQANQ